MDSTFIAGGRLSNHIPTPWESRGTGRADPRSCSWLGESGLAKPKQAGQGADRGPGVRPYQGRKTKWHWAGMPVLLAAINLGKQFLLTRVMVFPSQATGESLTTIRVYNRSIHERILRWPAYTVVKRSVRFGSSGIRNFAALSIERITGCGCEEF